MISAQKSPLKKLSAFISFQVVLCKVFLQYTNNFAEMHKGCFDNCSVITVANLVQIALVLLKLNTDSQH